MGKSGRPSLYTPEIADEIIERLANGETVPAICADAHMPSRSTVDRWNKSVPGFEAQCARARLQKGEVFEQKAVSIADAIARGQMDPNAGRSAANIYQWAAKVNCPQRYSDRIDIGNAGGKPFATSSDEDLRAELAALRAKHGPDKE